MKLFARLFGGPVLRNAIQSGDVKAFLEVVLATPELMTKRHKRGGTLLHWAAAYGQREIATFLLHNGADLNAKDDGGLAPLHLAATAEGARILVEAGADVNATDGKGNSPLGVAAEYNRADVALILLDSGAEVDAHNFTGATPLIYCAIYGHGQTAEVLLDAGADPKAKTLQGMTAGQVAEARRDDRLVALLTRKRQ